MPNKPFALFLMSMSLCLLITGALCHGPVMAAPDEASSEKKTDAAASADNQKQTAEQNAEAVVRETEAAAETPDDYEPGFYYTVKKGDTLWDLSRKFYDSQWVWPAMWAQNKDLENPHLIYPGQRIRLYQRTDALEHTDKPEPKPEPPPPEPEPEVVEETPAPEKAEVVEEPEPPELVYYMYPSMEQVGFIQKLDTGWFSTNPRDPHRMGDIFRVEGDNKEMISQGDTVYINPEENTSFIIGTRYCVYKPLEAMESPSSGNYVGHQYMVAGIAEITGTRDAYVIAKIIKSFRTINVGDNIMPFKKRSPEIPITEPPRDVSGELVGAENRANIFAGHDIAFINKGEKDGVKPGQRYKIYYKNTGKVDGKKVTLPAVTYGKFIVLLTRDTTATVLITSASKDIKPGAVFAATL
ncbi:MAG: LysM peptidoglycan-binding domain-containing protein [Thermodesulfobacteriota bacterium]|nr:LysM peptidoglycan-binding domain-containing protein [Thermodesulfobacteriota bacterium]